MKNACVSTDQSYINTYRHYSPQWVLFLPDWATAQTGKRGLYRSPPSGHNQRKTGYSWSDLTATSDIAEKNQDKSPIWSVFGAYSVQYNILSTCQPIVLKQKVSIYNLNTQNTMKLIWRCEPDGLHTCLTSTCCCSQQLCLLSIKLQILLLD